MVELGGLWVTWKKWFIPHAAQNADVLLMLASPSCWPSAEASLSMSA